MRTISQPACRLLLCIPFLLLLGVTSLSNPRAALAQARPSLQAQDTFDLTAQIDPRGRDLRVFVSWVADHLNNFWGGEFGRRQYQYQAPKVVFTVVGPNVICDRYLYVGGPGYFGPPCYTIVMLRNDFIAWAWVNGYDGAVAAAIAHEWSHYITTILGQITHGSPEELRADCHAGMFFRYAGNVRILETGDLEEAAAVMSVLGDPGHGTGPQREMAFWRGFNARGFGDCGREL